MLSLRENNFIKPIFMKLLKEEYIEDIEAFFLYYLEKQSFYTEKLRKCCEKIFQEKYQSISVRACIDDMNECDCHSVLGDDEKRQDTDILDKWCLQWKEESCRLRLGAKYPILKECIYEITINTATNLLLFFERFEQDKKQIEEQLLHRKITYITGIETSLSDAHNHGNSVIKVELDKAGYLIYKPHSLDNEKIFHETMKKLGEKIDLDFYSPPMICRDGYGWEIYVEQKSCDSDAEVHRYYKRIGVLLFLAYVLKSSDLHMENLIAYGEYPVFIDMEALFTPLDRLDGKNINECMAAFLRQSVMSTGILPFYHWNGDNKGINVSALSHEDVQTLPVRVPVVADKGTTNMHITYKYGKVYPAKNQVRLREEKIIPEDYVHDVLDGFQQIYRMVLIDKPDFRAYFERFTDLYSRYLVADTQKYSMLISLSYHPDLLKEKKKREDLFQILWKFKTRKSEYDDVIHNCEKEDLLQGDVPIFHVKYDSRHLYFHDKVVIEDYTDQTAMESVNETIENLSEKDMMRQCMVIETAMSFPKKLIGKGCIKSDAGNSIALDVKEKERLVKDGLNRILEQAIYSKDKTEIGWIAPQIVGKTTSRFALQNGGIYLYDGLAGMYLLFCEAVYGKGYVEYLDVCKKLENQIFTYTDTVSHGMAGEYYKSDQDDSISQSISKCQSHNTGILNGESSIVAAYLQIYNLTGNDKYLEMAKKHAQVVNQLLRFDENYDLLDGKAGAIIALIDLYKQGHDTKYLEQACDAEELLYENAYITEDEMCWIHKEYNRALLGMAHGTAGMLLAYGSLYETTRNDKYLNRLEKILRYEHRRYNEQTGDWYDYRKPEEMQSIHAESAAWCHGAGGILLSRLVLKKISLPERINVMIDRDISRAVKRVKTAYMRNSYCLCHGVGGNLLILEQYLDFLKDMAMGDCAPDESCDTSEYVETESLCKMIRDDLTEHILNDKQELLREKYGMGLMTGYGGIIYSMMKA